MLLAQSCAELTKVFLKFQISNIALKLLQEVRNLLHEKKNKTKISIYCKTRKEKKKKKKTKTNNNLQKQIKYFVSTNWILKDHENQKKFKLRV